MISCSITSGNGNGEKFHEGKMSDYIPTDEELRSSIDKLPKMD